MNEEISKIIELQVIDSEIDGFEDEIQAREQQIVEREKSIADKEEAIILSQQKIEELEVRQRDLKNELEDAQIRIKERQNKMMQVQTSREHQALLKEIEESKRLIKDNEEKILQVMEQAEQQEQLKAELTNLCNGEKKILKEAISEIEQEVNQINTRKKTVLEKREALIPELRSPIMKRYDMLRNKRKGAAVVPTRNGVCQGCFMTVPPQQDNDIRKGEKLNFCPTCQRILYYQEEDSE